jgi:hypothetical protein
MAGLPLVVRVPQFEKLWYSLCDHNSVAGFVFNFKHFSSYPKTELAS